MSPEASAVSCAAAEDLGKIKAAEMAASTTAAVGNCRQTAFALGSRVIAWIRIGAPPESRPALRHPRPRGAAILEFGEHHRHVLLSPRRTDMPPDQKLLAAVRQGPGVLRRHLRPGRSKGEGNNRIDDDLAST